MDAAGDNRLQTALGALALAGLAASAYLAASGEVAALCGLVVNAALLVGVLLPDESGRRFALMAATVGVAFSGWIVASGPAEPSYASLAGLAAMALALGLSALRLVGSWPRPHRAARAAPPRVAAPPRP
jgi:hypothetical protein